MLSQLKSTFNLWNKENIFAACLNLILKLKTIKVKYSLFVSSKNKFIANKFIKALIRIDFVEYELKSIDFSYWYHFLISSDEINDEDLKFLTLLELLNFTPTFFKAINFHIHLNEIRTNIYAIETHQIEFQFNLEKTKNSYHNIFKGKDSILFSFDYINNIQEDKSNKLSNSFKGLLKSYFNNFLSAYFDEGTYGNFLAEYNSINKTEKIFFVDK